MNRTRDRLSLFLQPTNRVPFYSALDLAVLSDRVSNNHMQLCLHRGCFGHVGVISASGAFVCLFQKQTHDCSTTVSLIHSCLRVQCLQDHQIIAEMRFTAEHRQVCVISQCRLLASFLDSGNVAVFRTIITVVQKARYGTAGC